MAVCWAGARSAAVWWLAGRARCTAVMGAGCAPGGIIWARIVPIVAEARPCCQRARPGLVTGWGRDAGVAAGVVAAGPGCRRAAVRPGPGDRLRGRGDVAAWSGACLPGRAQVAGGAVRGLGLVGTLLGVPQVGDGFGKRGQPDDQDRRREHLVLGEVSVGGDQPGAAAELVPGPGGCGDVAVLVAGGAGVRVGGGVRRVSGPGLYCACLSLLIASTRSLSRRTA